MPYDLQEGTEGLRAETIDSMVKQVAARQFKFMQAVAVVPTSAWKNTFFRENLTISAGPSGNVFKGVPRGGEFPEGVTTWEEVSVRITKFAVQANISWEDILSNDINVQARNIIRRTEEITKAVDDYIWDGLTQTTLTDSGLRVQSFAITLGRFWDVASAAIVNDLFEASRLIAENGNYDTNDLMCFVNPTDKKSIMTYLVDKGSQFPLLAQDITENGKIGKLAGIQIVESMSVPASYALVVKPKTCATFKELVSLRSTTDTDPYKSVRIRVVMEGALELTDPLAVCVIKGTKSA